MKQFISSDPEKAVDILFNKAMVSVPELSATQFRTAYDRMRKAWGSPIGQRSQERS